MILFLVTHFHDADRVAAFVEHVLSFGPGVCVAVADNSADSPFVRAVSDRVAVYGPPSNLGYLNGCAFALKAWLGDGRPEPEFVVVSNTDLSLDPGFARAMHDLDTAGVGVVAPDVRLPDGTPQNPFMAVRPSRARLEAYRFAFANGMLTRVLEQLERVKLARRTAADVTARDIYAAHGSVFVLTQEFFSSGGRVELDGFMFGEEIHIAEQARRHGLRTVLEPTLRATHEHRASTGRVARTLRRSWARERLGVLLREYY